MWGRVTRVEAIQQVFRNARALMEAAGGSLDDVQNVWVYLGMWDLHDDMVDTWVESFPDERCRPTRKTYWYPRIDIQLQLEGVLGGGRRVLEIPSSGTGTRSPWGRCAAGVFTASRVDGRDPTVGKVPRLVPAQARMMLKNLEALLDGEQGGLDDLFQTTALVGSAAYIPAVEEAWLEQFPSGGPALQFLELGLVAGDMLVQVIAEGAWSASGMGATTGGGR